MIELRYTDVQAVAEAAEIRCGALVIHVREVAVNKIPKPVPAVVEVENVFLVKEQVK